MTTQMTVLFNLVSLMFKPSIIGFEANVAVKEQSLQENVELRSIQYKSRVFDDPILVHSCQNRLLKNI